MKILRLYLKNFAHIYSGLGKYEINLDFSSNSKVINIIIGKMGSCKTVILGHLQPFHSFGTLDVRNQDSIILEGEDGLKIIEYKKGNDYYIITHKYTWNQNTHNVKSYIDKNGTELNPNGNHNSFRSIIECEFGIEQSFLRLLRLGPNVANVISMKSTERKSFVASLLQDAEVYTMLYKKLSEDMRLINSKINVLSNKLHHIGVSNEDNVKEELESNNEIISDYSQKLESTKTSIYKMQGIIYSILKGKSYNDYKSEYNDLQSNLNKSISLKKEYKEKLDTYKEYPSINEVSKIIGGIDNEILSNNEALSKLETYHIEIGKELGKLLDRKKIIGSTEQIAELKNRYNELMEKLDDYKENLKNFKCDYTSQFITQLIGDLNTVNVLISEVSQYNPDTIRRLYHSDSSIITWSKNQIDILNAKKYKLQKDINNIKFSEKYEAPSTLYFPPLCPTHTCPYYVTHPHTIKKKHKCVNEVDTELVEIMDVVNKIDSKINIYTEYPYIYTKLVTLKQLWKKNFPILSRLNALQSKSLLDTLTNMQYQKWYNYDKLIKAVELCEKREKYYELTENLNKVKNELQIIKLSDDSSLEEKISYLEKEIDDTVTEIATYEERNKELTEKLKQHNDIYMELSQMHNTELEYEKIESTIEDVKNTLNEMNKNIDELSSNTDIINKLSLDEANYKSKLKEYTERNEKLKALLNDITYTKLEFETSIEEKETLKYILDAVSSKEGIPLVLVKIFLNSCKDILNDLVSDVFGDTIEILDFHITDTEFKIPYSINGTYVEDIEKASQGQQSIISIALSFALIRQSMFDYNIMLLDEVDAPLYKHDRNKFISILFKQLQAINAEQVFLISHNNTFDGYAVNIIMTTEEIVGKSELNTIMRV